jgi:hypothetical protein
MPEFRPLSQSLLWRGSAELTAAASPDGCSASKLSSMHRKSPFWLIALILLGLLALLPLARTQSKAARGKSAAQKTPTSAQAQAGAPQASPLPSDLEIKRLILKDGSYQPVTKIEIRGERVRYLSAERYEWEDVPYSLVDWAATEKYAREAAKPQIPAEAQALDAEEQAERKKQEELTPMVAPGLRLPSNGGVFLLDVYKQQAQLNELVQNGGEVKRNTGTNVLRATINPLASQKQTIELKGQHARIQSHVNNPFFYVNIDQDPDVSTASNPQDTKNRFRIVAAEPVPKKDVRVVGNIKIAVYGKVSQQQKFVPATVETFSGPWLKITPAEPLEPGEYAIAEILSDNQMNLYVWDFGVNPTAPENPGVWRAEPVKSAPTPETPVLKPPRNP